MISEVESKLTENDKIRIWPIITDVFGIKPLDCSSKRRAEVELGIAEICNFVLTGQMEKRAKEIEKISNRLDDARCDLMDLSMDLSSQF